MYRHDATLWSHSKKAFGPFLVKLDCPTFFSHGQKTYWV